MEKIFIINFSDFSTAKEQLAEINEKLRTGNGIVKKIEGASQYPKFLVVISDSTE